MGFKKTIVIACDHTSLCSLSIWSLVLHSGAKGKPMTAQIVSVINYQELKDKYNLSNNELKAFLLNHLEEIYAILCEIDFAIAGDQESSILNLLSEIKLICSTISADVIHDFTTILEDLLIKGSGSSSIIHYQSRLINILNVIRASIFSYQQMINNDL